MINFDLNSNIQLGNQGLDIFEMLPKDIISKDIIYNVYVSGTDCGYNVNSPEFLYINCGDYPQSYRKINISIITGMRPITRIFGSDKIHNLKDSELIIYHNPNLHSLQGFLNLKFENTQSKSCNVNIDKMSKNFILSSFPKLRENHINTNFDYSMQGSPIFIYYDGVTGFDIINSDIFFEEFENKFDIEHNCHNWVDVYQILENYNGTKYFKKVLDILVYLCPDMIPWGYIEHKNPDMLDDIPISIQNTFRPSVIRNTLNIFNDLVYK